MRRSSAWPPRPSPSRLRPEREHGGADGEHPGRPDGPEAGRRTSNERDGAGEGQHERDQRADDAVVAVVGRLGRADLTRSEPKPREADAEEGAAPFVEERLDSRRACDRRSLGDLGGCVPRAGQGGSELCVGRLAAGRRCEPGDVLERDVEGVLEPAEREGSVSFVEQIRLGRDGVEAGQRPPEICPELAELLRVYLFRAGLRRHHLDRSR